MTQFRRVLEVEVSEGEGNRNEEILDLAFATHCLRELKRYGKDNDGISSGNAGRGGFGRLPYARGRV